MARVTGWIYEKECRLFKWVNSRLQHRLLDKYFNAITHFGGATATIITTLLVLLFAPDNARIFLCRRFPVSRTQPYPCGHLQEMLSPQAPIPHDTGYKNLQSSAERPFLSVRAYNSGLLRHYPVVPDPPRSALDSCSAGLLCRNLPDVPWLALSHRCPRRHDAGNQFRNLFRFLG